MKTPALSLTPMTSKFFNTMENIQKQLSRFQSDVLEAREALGTVGGDSTANGDVPNVSSVREDLFRKLTTEAITNQIRFVSEDESVILNRIHRIEHQSWIRGETADGAEECVNLMDVNEIEIV